MNSDTGHLIRPELLAAMSEHERQQYEPLPDSLLTAAVLKLRGQAEATVSRSSGGRLSKYAASRRKAKRDSRRAMEKATRKAQR